MTIPVLSKRLWGVAPALLALAFLPTACRTVAPISPDQQVALRAVAVDRDTRQRAAAAGERVVAYDLNGDGANDLWKFFMGDKLVRKEIDSNWDGIVDTWRFYDDAGHLYREAFDLNGDGQPDRWVDHTRP